MVIPCEFVLGAEKLPCGTISIPYAAKPPGVSKRSTLPSVMVASAKLRDFMTCLTGSGSSSIASRCVPPFGYRCTSSAQARRKACGSAVLWRVATMPRQWSFGESTALKNHRRHATTDTIPTAVTIAVPPKSPKMVLRRMISQRPRFERPDHRIRPPLPPKGRFCRPVTWADAAGALFDKPSLT